MEKPQDNPEIIAQSRVMRQILEDVKTIAGSHASVFLSGESGTGKEVIARALHDQSTRSKGPLICVNCAAMPPPLLESEFFGHERGAFTGAIQKRPGRFELAHGGTLLLDEVSEIPLELQPKLLRALQEQQFERVGGIVPVQVDVRLIATSNRNMKEEVERKRFREDLYYRLNVVPIHLPPLRERPEDILPLAEYFLERLCKLCGKPPPLLSAEACSLLRSHCWPGNVRELANVIERCVVMHTSHVIGAEQVQLDFPSSRHVPVGLSLHDMEKRLILETLAATAQNKTKAARILQISVRTLRNKLKAYAL